MGPKGHGPGPWASLCLSALGPAPGVSLPEALCWAIGLCSLCITFSGTRVGWCWGQCGLTWCPLLLPGTSALGFPWLTAVALYVLVLMGSEWGQFNTSSSAMAKTGRPPLLTSKWPPLDSTLPGQLCLIVAAVVGSVDPSPHH